MSNPVEPPIFSIIIAVLNGAATLGRCLESVAVQELPRNEVVVMDGGSIDGTLELLAAYPHPGRITWESRADRGIYHAWNKAVARARGEWLCFLGADDALATPTALAEVAAALERLPPECRLVYGRVTRVDRAGRVVDCHDSPWNPERFWAEGPYFHLPGVFFHRSLFARVGEFDESLRIAADYDLLVRILSQPVGGDDVAYLPVVVSVMRLGGVSNAPRHALVALREYRAVRMRHGLPLARTTWWWLLLKGALKVIIARTLGERVVEGIRLLGGVNRRGENGDVGSRT